PVANRAHHGNNLGCSARGRSRGAITRFECWHGWGTSRPFSVHFWINGGECGEGRDSLALIAPQRAASFLLNKHVHAAKPLAELLKAEEIERGWHDHDR